MAGMKLNQALIDHALGYDDNHRSTEDSRKMYWCLWNAGDAHPARILQLGTPKVYMRPPANEGEYRIQKIVEATLKRMTTLEKK